MSKSWGVQFPMCKQQNNQSLFQQELHINTVDSLLLYVCMVVEQGSREVNHSFMKGSLIFLLLIQLYSATVKLY